MVDVTGTGAGSARSGGRFKKPGTKLGPRARAALAAANAAAAAAAAGTAVPSPVGGYSVPGSAGAFPPAAPSPARARDTGVVPVLGSIQAPSGVLPAAGSGLPALAMPVVLAAPALPVRSPEEM
jgi:hypothetical protein